MWQFDEEVAKRFAAEARDHIPDYDRVIDMCVDIANKSMSKDSVIVDVGSALGATVDRFISAGYTNVYGVECSQEMIDKTLHPDRIIKDSSFPSMQCDFVMANWTLHFVGNRIGYIKSIYQNMNSGVFILTDKTDQSRLVKMLYYQWKQDNGVDPAYILQKEVDLEGVLITHNAQWYMDIMKEAGFKNIQIINSRFGFVTFYGEK